MQIVLFNFIIFISKSSSISVLHETTLQKAKKPWYKVIKNSNRFFLITITHIRPISIIPEVPTFLPTQPSSLRYQTKHFRNKIFPHQSRHLRAFSHCLLALVARLKINVQPIIDRCNAPFFITLCQLLCNQAARKIYWSIIDIQKKRKKFPNLTEYLSLSFYQFVLILIDRKIEINDSKWYYYCRCLTLKVPPVNDHSSILR